MLFGPRGFGFGRVRHAGPSFDDPANDRSEREVELLVAQGGAFGDPAAEAKVDGEAVADADPDEGAAQTATKQFEFMTTTFGQPDGGDRSYKDAEDPKSPIP